MRGSDLAAQAFHIAGPDPDRRTFEGALDALGVDAEEAVMVGDRIGLDGGAIRVGIATWLLPAGIATGDQPRGLRRLLSLSR